MNLFKHLIYAHIRFRLKFVCKLFISIIYYFIYFCLLKFRIDPLDHKHIPLVIPEKLEYQRELVKAYGSLDALGTIHQMPNGAIDTRDFGKNIHDRKIGRIKPDEKKWALRKLENQLAETLARALWKQLRIMKNTAIAKFSPVIVFP